jgi:hypothetical protein
MKKFAIVLGAAALLALPSLASAQSTATGSIAATATVATVLDFGTSPGMNFGIVTPGTTSSSVTGYIPFTRNVGVSFTLPDGTTTGRLTRAGGTETLQPTFSACGVGTTNSAITSAFSACGGAGVTAATVVGTLTAPTAGPTSEFVIFTGTVAVPTAAVPGRTPGTIKITATAN